MVPVTVMATTPCGGCSEYVPSGGQVAASVEGNNNRGWRLNLCSNLTREIPM